MPFPIALGCINQNVKAFIISLTLGLLFGVFFIFCSVFIRLNSTYIQLFPTELKLEDKWVPLHGVGYLMTFLEQLIQSEKRGSDTEDQREY